VNDGYGLCLYHGAATGELYTFVVDKKGQVEQWRLFDDGQGKIDAEMVRAFAVGSHSEGCTADDALGNLYIAEEAVGIWKYGAEPDRGEDRVQVDVVGDAMHLLPDIEGLALYVGPDDSGYLIASSQGRSAFAVYERSGDNAYVGTFSVEHGADVDGVSTTEGIGVTSAPLGDAFPQGMLVAQDARNDDRQRNFKLVSWQAIAQALGLPG
jgi:3-phytase